ncbi:phage integrase SAM-like domain-containing protein [Kaistella sp. PBT33-4]|uniref:site-specific integrase n=1 Tax=Kaistella sp. PBT33-4 TaxID=3032000 RepID=UPI0023D8A2B1|nr:site-specific integrase [Kaistella sp. PBT33-4]MDF0719188.1 phage integrase SAM-like domain-containing protein [Kaistella sp. PBT33-4]
MANVEFKVYSNKFPVNLNVRFYHNKIDLSAKTNIFLDSDEFVFKRVAVGKKSKSTITLKADKVKQQVSALETMIIDRFKEDFPKNNTIDKLWLSKIIDSFHQRADDNSDIRFFLTPFIEFYIDKAKQQINPITGKKLDKKTITRYKYTLNMLRQYEEYSQRKLRISEVDLYFHNDFLHYLLEVCTPYGAETIKKFIGHIRQFVRAAQQMGYQTHPEVESPRFTYRSGETIDTYLNEDEIDRLYNMDFSANKRLENVRDLFLVGLRTGLRLSDLKRINSFEISNNTIKISEIEKTDKFVEIPLHPQVKAIVERRSNRFPEISEQRFNEYIKQVCQLAGIDEVILGAKKDSTTNRKVKGYYPKYELISSHTCRRSFVTNLYGKLEDLTIMAITGHKKHSQFLDYVKTTDRQHINKLAEHWNKDMK